MAVITDEIAERTAGAGVTVDGLLIKDGALPDVTPGDIGAEVAGAAATAVSDHETAYDHDNIPSVDEASALTAYQSALAAAGAGQVLTASGPGAAAFAAVAGGPSLSDYSNVIVVDAGGNGDYTTLAAAVAAAGTSDLIIVFGGTYSDVISISAARTIWLPSYSTVISGAVSNSGPGLNILGHGRISSLSLSGSGIARIFPGIRVASVEISGSARLETMHADIDSLSVLSATANYKIRGSRIGSLYFSLATAASDNRYISSCDIEGAFNDVPFTSMPLYHCRIVAIDPGTVGVVSGNYSNTLAGITWPTIP